MYTLDLQKGKQPIKDPKGGLTERGRRHFEAKEGGDLKPGVKGPADTPEKMRRKGSFLRRHYAGAAKPLKDEKGRPTRHALQARAWGEPVPQDQAAVRRLAAKGKALLERYSGSKEKNVKKSFVIDTDKLQKSQVSELSPFEGYCQFVADLTKGLYRDKWYEMFEGTPVHAQAVHDAANQAREVAAIGADRRVGLQKSHMLARQNLLVTYLEHQASMNKSVVMAGPGEPITMDVNDEYRGYPIPMTFTEFVSADDEGAWMTIPLGPRLRLHLKEMMTKIPVNPRALGMDEKGNSMSKSVYDEIRAFDSDALVKALNNPGKGSMPDNGNAMVPTSDAPQGQNRRIGQAQGKQYHDAKYDDEKKSGMPTPGNAGGAEQVWSSDDTRVMSQLTGRDSKSPYEVTRGGSAGAAAGAPDLGNSVNQKYVNDSAFPDKKPHGAIMKSTESRSGGFYQHGMLQVGTSEDEWISKSMQGLSIPQTPTLGRPGIGINSLRKCNSCDAHFMKALTTCTECGADQFAKSQLHPNSVVIDEDVQKSLREAPGDEIPFSDDIFLK